MNIKGLLSGFLCVILLVTAVCCGNPGIDRVFLNAKVYSVRMDGVVIRAGAVAVDDGKIVYVGDDEGAKVLAGRKTEVRDCGGNTLLPAFNDGHMHFTIAARRFDVASLYAVPGNDDTPETMIAFIRQELKEFAESHPDDPVIHGAGWDRTWFERGLGRVRPFTRHDIDAVIPDRPVVLHSHCGHCALFNSKALEIAGMLSADAPRPVSGLMRRGPDGIPDGYVQESGAIDSITARIPDYEFTEGQIRSSMLEAQRVFLSRGYAMVTDNMKTDGVYEVLKDMAVKDELRLRLCGAVFNIYDDSREDNLSYAIRHRDDYNVPDKVTVDAVKYFVDGNPASLAQYTRRYLRDRNLPGDFMEPLLWNEKHLVESMSAARAAGFNIHVHCKGDRAQRVAVNAIIEAQKQNEGHGLRNIIAHDMMVDDREKALMGENHIIANLQPLWMGENPVNAREMAYRYGVDNQRRFYPYKSLLDAGVVCATGTDFAVTMPDPLGAIQTAMTRRVLPTAPIYGKLCADVPAMAPEECVSLEDIIKSMTVNVAYQFHMEDVTGSIETGKSADMVLLDGDIEKTPVDEIYKLNVVETVIRGKTEYMAGD